MRLLSPLVPLVGLALLAGCGGGGSSHSDGKSRVTIDWPATTRAFVGSSLAGSARIVFSNSRTLDQVAEFTVVRPSGTSEVKKTYALPEKVAPNSYFLTVVFCAGADGSPASEVGSGSTVANVGTDGKLTGSDGKGLGDVVFSSTLKSLAVLPNQQVLVGQRTSLLVSATTSNDGIVAVPYGEIALTVTQGAALRANDDGTVTGLAPGTANVTARAFGLQSAAVPVTVSAAP